MKERKKVRNTHCVFSTELAEGEQSTLLGTDFEISFGSNAIFISDQDAENEDAAVVAADELGTNGVVHLVDRVLLPQ